jgi:hypothetical protein
MALVSTMQDLNDDVSSLLVDVVLSCLNHGGRTSEAHRRQGLSNSQN